MAKTTRLEKAIEKFRKNAEKELERAQSLQKKSEKLKTEKDVSSSAVDRFFERLRQKELQATGEIAWAGQLLEELRPTTPKKDKAKKKSAEGLD